MALTEEQLKVFADFGVTISQESQLDLLHALIAALPKPEAVCEAIQEPGSAVRWWWTDAGLNLPKGTLLYTEAPIAKPASAPSEQKPVALPFAIFDQEMADLRRFHECVTDGEGYDVPKDRMKRLAEIGLVRRVSANYYEHTDFGLSVLNGDFDAEPQTDYKAQRDALLKSLEEALECGEDGDWQSARRVLVSAIASVKGGAE